MAVDGSVALGALVWSEVRRPAADWKARADRLLVVLLAIIFLFPCVTASDDLMTLAGLQFIPETRGEVGNPRPRDPGGDKPVANLERLFESLQTFRIPVPYGLLVALLFVAFIARPGARASERRLAVACGRAPPPVL